MTKTLWLVLLCITLVCALWAISVSRDKKEWTDFYENEEKTVSGFELGNLRWE